MPTWKKIVVSGSGISQLTNDANYLAAGGAFSASVDSRLDVSETLSGSAHTQRAALSASSATANTNLSSSTATALRSEYVASVSSLSGSASTQREAQKSAADARLAAIETFTGSLDSSFATDAELGTLSGSAHTDRVAKVNVLSGSAHLQREAIKGLATSGDTALSSSAHVQREVIKGLASTANTSLSSSTHTANTNLSSSTAGALRTEYVAGDTALSSSLNTRIVSLESGGGTAGLSASAHVQREAIKGLATSANESLSGSSASSLRTEYVAADTALSSSQKTYIDAKVAGIVNSAPATLDTLDELAAALNDDPNFSASIATSIGNKLGAAYSSSAAGALRAELVAGDSALSSSSATNLRAEYVAGDSALSASAHGDRVAKIAVLSASAHTARATGATSASSHTQRVALINTLSSSAATANDSSAITVRNLVGQAVVASSFEGDGSNLTNITVDQNATVASNFTGVTSHAVTHNFGTKNVLVQVYDDNDQVIIPASITSTNTNTSTVTFDGASTGIVVVARGGHVVSGSIPYANLINTPSASFSSRIDALSGSGHAQRIAVVSVLSSSVDAHLDANITTLSASAHAARAGGATSASAHTQRIAVVNIHSSSAASALRSEYVAADTALSSSQKTYIDAKVAGIVDSAPGTLDTLNELAAALNDDPNFSASIATSIGNKLATGTFNTYSSSAATDLRAEYVAGDSALSASAHAQRVIEKGIAAGLVTSLADGAVATNAADIASLSGSSASAFRTEYVAGDTAISGALNTRIVALEGAGTTSALSASAHAQRVIEKDIAAGLVTALSNGAVATNATAITTLSGSSAALLRAEIVAGDSALSGSAHAQRVIEKGIAADLVSALSSSKATDLRAEYTAADTALSSSQNTYINAKIAGIVNSAPATLDTLDELAAALNDDPNFSASIATSIGNRQTTANQLIYSASSAAALRAEHVAKDGVLSGSAHAQRVIEKNIAAGLVTALSNGAVATNASAITTLSGSSATALTSLSGSSATVLTNLSGSSATAIRTEYKAGDTALSSSLNTRIVSLEGAGTTSALSASAHAQRIIEKNIAAGLVTALSDGAVTDNADNINSLSGSAHAQRVIEKGIAAGLVTALSNGAVATNASAISTLSGSAHTDRVAKVNALSASAHTARGSISSQFTIAGGAGSDTFETGQTLTFAGTGNEIETTVTNNQVQIGITTNPTLSGNVIVTGDLTVQGDTFENQVTNLNVEDRFILLNSGSNSGDVGIIFGGSDGVANQGSGIFWDSPSNIFGFADGIGTTDTAATHDAKLGAITTSTAAPTATPTFQGVGSIHVKTDTEDVYIYTAD